jgi:hypothetical protein
MTDHHDHTWDDDHGSHGVQPPPSDGDLRVWEFSTVRGAEPVPLHFFKGPGPMNVRRIAPRRIRLRNGTYLRCTWEFRWYLDYVEGCSKYKALTKIYDVLLHPSTWSRSGVHWKRVLDRSQADILVRVLPQDKTVCGPGAAGCYSWGGGKPPVAEMGVEYIDRPGPFAALTNMELLGHGTFRVDDQYFAVHQPYPTGVMGSWQSMAAAGYYPTHEEIESSKQWLRGETPSELIHSH